MLNARFVPVGQWPGAETPPIQRRDSPFRSTYLATLDLIESELGKLRAREILIQAYFTRDQLRNDSWPKAGCTPARPGVILTFESSKGLMSFPCDAFSAYQGNLRAIGLGLKALRAVDRYGVTRSAEQYKGWAQIEAPKSRFTVEEAATFLMVCSNIPANLIIGSEAQFRAAYRAAASKVHPDAAEGDTEAFLRVSSAREVLEKHHAGKGK